MNFGWLLIVRSCISDLYSLVFGQSALIDDILRKMKSRVNGELKFQEQLLALNGALDMVLAQVRGVFDRFGDDGY
jgi:U3 small nucleolar RNA-associated protein 15